MQENDKTWQLTAIYASPTENLRKDLWEDLQQMASLIDQPWMLIGDFNTYASPKEKIGGTPATPNKCQQFSNI